MPRGAAAGERSGSRQKARQTEPLPRSKKLLGGFGPGCITRLTELAGLTDRPGADNPAVQLQALRELLDRGFDKPTQPVEDGAEMPRVIEFVWGPAHETIEAPRPGCPATAPRRIR